MPRSVIFLLWAVLCVVPAHALQTLRVLAWPGYADADWVAQFEQQFDARVEVTVVGSDEVLWQKISANGGADFDLVAANTVEVSRYIDHKLLQPLNLALVPHVQQQLPRFKDAQHIAGIHRLGEVFAVPYTYASMGLIYDRSQFQQPPESVQALWNPAWRGKVLAFDDSSHNFSLASLALGGKPFDIAPTALHGVVQHLIALRRNVLTFYSLPEESVALFKQHKVAVMFANYGQQQVKELRDAGVDVGYVIPREGALAWLDCWAMTAGARNPALAHAWINFMLSPDISRALTRRQGLANTLDATADTRDSDKLWWLEPVEDAANRIALWTRIVSGDRPERFK